VAGRVLPGRYPRGATSRIYRNERGSFIPDATFANIGMVASAQFADLNNDGAPDLIMACEWGPVRIFFNERGKFSERSLGLEKYLGWWTSVVTGDFNNDGLTDIIAGNWGRNTRYE